MKHLNKVSRFLSLILRHKPETIGVELDKEGWISVDTILEKLEITKNDLDYIVKTNDKQRFHYDETEVKIRAAQGHSKDLQVIVDMDEYIPEVGMFLLHGTSNIYIKSILKNGLKPMSRKDVHLSKDADTAKKVGLRRDKEPIILKIDARKMYIDGHKFRVSKNGVILSEFVPPEYISLPGV